MENVLKIGIIGCGAIGSRVAAIAKNGFGMSVTGVIRSAPRPDCPADRLCRHVHPAQPLRQRAVCRRLPVWDFKQQLPDRLPEEIQAYYDASHTD